MSLLTEALAVTTRMGGVCGIQLLLERMSEPERAELREGLYDLDPRTGRPVQAKALSVVLAKRGATIPPQTINRHRRGDCTCPR